LRKPHSFRKKSHRHAQPGQKGLLPEESGDNQNQNGTDR
jgi:hypothetical protein